ncbi:MAG: hypothetical protein IAG13_31570, partial [Deltaproteobacteria bacterium]|nr:hypothetical protein [Nannocystaceae bacterium]
MSAARTALFDHLRAADDSSKQALAAALEGIDLETARARAKDDPASAEAAATLIGRLALDGVDPAEVLETA